MEVNCSGNRGYHVHVRDPRILKLGAQAREEISDYVFGNGIDTDAFFKVDAGVGARGKQLGPSPSDGGWRGKVAKAFLEATLSKEAMTSLGIDKDTASWIFRHHDAVREQVGMGNWDFHPIPNRQDVLSTLLHTQEVKQGNKIDRNVTREPSHLIRLPNTIHGGTGLVARKLPSMAALGAFEPLKDAIAFGKGELRVRASSKYALVLNGQTFGPYKEEAVTLPTYAATYLYLKGLADVLTAR
jgi:DNA primase small subunit